MSEAEKQEGQKTVVAFITGLLIGGLLVWVFSSTPEEKPADTSDTDTTVEEVDSNDSSDAATPSTSTVTNGSDVKVVASGNGRLSVDDQKASEEVALEDVAYSGNAGWIVVRDYADGAAGRILGASRYNVTDGLTPDSVSLLRATEKGKEYQVSFYSENGDGSFSTKDDTPIAGGESTFKAE